MSAILCQASALFTAVCGDDDGIENLPCPNKGTHTMQSRGGVEWVLCADCSFDLETLLGIAGRVLDANPEAVAEIERRRRAEKGGAS